MKRKEEMDQLRDMSVDELKDQADTLKESLFRLKFHKTSALAKSSRTFVVRRRRLQEFTP